MNFLFKQCGIFLLLGSIGIFKPMYCSADSEVSSQQEVVSLEGCHYYPPEGSADVQNLIGALRARSKIEESTFKSILKKFKKIKKNTHRFEFSYPIPDERLGPVFCKILAIKTLQANRFVTPIISKCEYIEPCHLGFLRKIEVQGTEIVERVLQDTEKNRVMFIEEEGPFAAVNQIRFENGKWYFKGTYLYSEIKDVDSAKKMFDDTFQNMLNFALSGDVDTIYDMLY